MLQTISMLSSEYFLAKSKITKMRQVYKSMGAKYHLAPSVKSGGAVPCPPDPHGSYTCDMYILL